MVDVPTRRRITAAWQKELADFQVWRPYRLLRRIGPVLQGVCLDSGTGGTYYYPSSHIHMLTSLAPVITLTMNCRVNSVHVAAGDNVIRPAIAELARRSPLPLEMRPTLPEILTASRNDMEKESVGLFAQCEDVVLVSAFLGSADVIDEHLEFARNYSRRWRYVPDGYRSTEEWVDALRGRASNLSDLYQLVEANVARLKVERIT